MDETMTNASISMAFSIVWLMQFAYRMPELYPERRRESRIALGVTLLLSLWEIGFAAHRYAALLEGKVVYRPANADFFTAAVFIWLLIVLLRQTTRAKQGNPQNRNARATRQMALVSLLPVGLTAVLLLQGKFALPVTAASLLLSMGLLLTMLLFALVYLNYLPEQTSFMLRISAITLAFFLAVLGVVGQATAPAFVAAYHNHNLLAAPRTVRFTPNAASGYDITQIPYAYEEELGKRLARGENSYVRLPLGFEFPFYNRNWSDLFMYKDGAVTFGRTPNLDDTQFRYGSTPSIYLMGIPLENVNSTERPSGYICAKQQTN